MRYSFFLIVFVFLAAACSQSTAGLTIQPQQQFVLGEYMREGFKASLDNRGSTDVTAVIVTKKTGEEVSRLKLARGKKASITVSANEEARFYNPNDRPAEILVVMNKTVEGMRNLDLEGNALPETEKDYADRYVPRPATDPVMTPTSEIDTNIPARNILIIGEGTATTYSADLRNFGGRKVEISIRDKTTGRQTQGFGMGVFGQVTVNLGPNENLHIENFGGKETRFRVKLTEAVSGSRLEAL